MTAQTRTTARRSARSAGLPSAAPAEGAAALRSRQRSLVSRYRRHPSAARVRDQARTGADAAGDEAPLDPLHTRVELGSGHSVAVPVAVHRAVGGLSDLSVPGDILCAALASCADSSLRVVANALEVELRSLSVEAVGEVDVRGALYVSPDVPVGFQRFHLKVFVRAARGTDPGRLERVLASAERSCVVLQTLRCGVPVSVEYDAAPLPEAE